MTILYWIPVSSFDRYLKYISPAMLFVSYVIYSLSQILLYSLLFLSAFLFFYYFFSWWIIGSNKSNDNDENDNEKDLKATAQEMLLSLPCINVHNFRAVMDRVESIAELSTLSELDLTPLLGSGNAKKLFTFFRRRQNY